MRSISSGVWTVSRKAPERLPPHHHVDRGSGQPVARPQPAVLMQRDDDEKGKQGGGSRPDRRISHAAAPPAPRGASDSNRATSGYADARRRDRPRPRRSAAAAPRPPPRAPSFPPWLFPSCPSFCAMASRCPSTASPPIPSTRTPSSEKGSISRSNRMKSRFLRRSRVASSGDGRPDHRLIMGKMALERLRSIDPVEIAAGEVGARQPVDGGSGLPVARA